MTAFFFRYTQMFNYAANKSNALLETAEYIRGLGKRVVFLGVVPGAHYDVLECMRTSGPLSALRVCPSESPIQGALRGTQRERTRMITRAKFREAFKRFFRSKELKDLGGVDFIDPAKVLCKTPSKCMVAKDGKPLYSDAIHLTGNATRLLRPQIERLLE